MLDALKRVAIAGAGLYVVLLMAVPSFARTKKFVPTLDGIGVERECSTVLDMNIYHPRKPKTKHEAYALGYCLGLIQGAYANLSGTYFCPPDGVKIEHVADSVVRFVKEHTDLEKKDAADIVRWSLSDEYPCPAGKQAAEN